MIYWERKIYLLLKVGRIIYLSKESMGFLSLLVKLLMEDYAVMKSQQWSIYQAIVLDLPKIFCSGKSELNFSVDFFAMPQKTS